MRIRPNLRSRLSHARHGHRAHSFPVANSDANAAAHSRCSYARRHANADSCAYPYSNPNPNACSHRAANSYPYSNACSYCAPYADANANSYPYANSHRDADAAPAPINDAQQRRASHLRAAPRRQPRLLGTRLHARVAA